MIRIESNFESTMRFPYPPAIGRTPTRFFDVKPRNADGTPGITELPELDALTINRMRYWYERRPIDAKDKGNPNAPHLEIGLLKIVILNDDGTTGGGNDNGPKPQRPARRMTRSAA